MKTLQILITCGVAGEIQTEVSEDNRLRELEAENARLKRLLAEAELDKSVPKELVEGNGDGRAAAPGRGSPHPSPHQ